MTDTRLAPEVYRRYVSDDIAGIASILGRLEPADWSRAVPSCPGWTVTDLVSHLGGVHRKVVAAITFPGQAPGRLVRPDIPDLTTWFTAGSHQLLAALSVGPQAPAWSFPGTEQTVGFWLRRQAMENAVHRIDLELAVGIDRPVPARLAADGVSEVLDAMLPLRVTAGVLTLPEYAVELKAHDVSWRLGHGELIGSAAGDASALFAVLWKRASQSVLALDGDVEAAEAMLNLPLTP